MSRPKIITPPKKCEICNLFFERPYGTSQKNFSKRRFCSPTCQNTMAASFRLGKKMSQDAIEKIRAFQKNKIFSAETRRKISEARRGEKHHWWKGGITKRNYSARVLFMNSYDYKLWRKNIFIRDNYTCLNCNKRGGYLNADHIKPYSIFPELRLDISNGRTLCVKCHKEIGWRGNQYIVKIAKENIINYK